MNQSNAVPLAIVVVDESLAMAAVVGEPNASGTPSHDRGRACAIL